MTKQTPAVAPQAAPAVEPVVEPTVEASTPEAPAPAEPAAPPKGFVTVRVLPKGDGEIFTGESVNGEFTRYARGDRPAFPVAVAQALEDRGFVEIL